MRATSRAGRATRATAGSDAVAVETTVIARYETRGLRKFRLERKDGDRQRIFKAAQPEAAAAQSRRLRSR
jgi:hypothetical protein